MMRSGVISVRMGMLPEMKTTEPYSPSARAKARAKPVSSAGSRRRQDHAARRSASGSAPRLGGGLLDLRVQFLEHGLHRAHHEGQADEDEGDHRCPAG